MSAGIRDVEHDYHLVNPSPWPATGAFSALMLASGFLAFMHPSYFGGDAVKSFGAWVFAPGIIGILFTMFVWWRDVIAEALQGDHKPVVQLGMRYGMMLFIVSEVMFFVAFFWAFFDASLFQSWPPTGIEPVNAWDLPLLLTLILLLSSTTVTWAHHAVTERGKNPDVTMALGLTVLLGIIFTVLQGYEYSHTTFGFTDGIFASTFYMATGFHGFHVLIGTIFLLVCYLRAKRKQFKTDHHFGLEAAAWYWHFVDVVWLFLFICVYWLSAI
ncbi:MAG: cytochrome c oxidase subunit 3 [Alphaproteobacteria bacterium]|nr:cytochrome c oxidase subunit 3 [Alphaproteobacteria bacterium]